MPIEDELKKLSDEPGVYIFKNTKSQIIYIGKANNLKSRVRSYWNKSSWRDRPKLGALVPHVIAIETIITKSEKEALILESNLVFKHQPKYNVLLKANDKRYPWLVITYDEPYPRLIPVRDIDSYKSKTAGRNSRNKFFGPYTNISAMYENLNLVNELFPLRKKRIPPFRDRPCLNYDLGRCLGPCQKLVSEADYQLMLDQVEMLLKGKYQDLKSILEQEMYRYSDNQEYEKAAKARDRIRSLETFNEIQNVVFDDHTLEQDIFALVLDDAHDLACMQVFKTRKGRLVNRDTLELDLNKEEDSGSIMASALEQYYAKVPDSELPKEILLSEEIEDADLYAEWLSERKKEKIKILVPRRGDKFAQIMLAKRNGKVLLEKLKLEMMEEASKNINVALENLAQELGLRQAPQRIECYDISHLQGTNVVASMVCFIDGMPVKDQYRRYKLRVEQNNDFASMQEIIGRRFKKHLQEQNSHEGVEDQSHLNNIEGLPDLIIIDGGKGQLNAAHEILTGMGFGHIKICGLAKKEEEIFLPGESQPIILDRKAPELFLVQRIRNEAHRFAISFHRKLRSQTSFKSKLDEIPGLGPKKKAILLSTYKTLSKIKEASLEELASLRGFNMELAKQVKDLIA